jgi:hypothetical protein
MCASSMNMESRPGSRRDVRVQPLASRPGRAKPTGPSSRTVLHAGHAARRDLAEDGRTGPDRIELTAGAEAGHKQPPTTVSERHLDRNSLDRLLKSPGDGPAPA